MDHTAKKYKLTSDAIHNRNCYAYFLQLKPSVTSQISILLPEFATLQSIIDQEYDENYPYGDLYTSCVTALEKYIEDNPTKEQIEALDDLVHAIYHNDNHILEEASQWINDIGAQARPQKPITARKIEQSIRDTRKNINQLSPSYIGSIFHGLYSLFADDFKPQLGTNLPSIKNYSYLKKSDRTEYRFGTQAQRHQRQVRISPLFKRWLELNAKKSGSNRSTCHIYFNNLALDRTALNIEGAKERDLTLELHKLEDDPKLKIVVITLPAYEGLMDSSDYGITNDRLLFDAVSNEFLDLAIGKPHKSGISDFRMSQATRNLLFGTPENEKIILKKLIAKSFLALGLTDKKFISTAEKQSVWVHFIKYELTNHILNQVKPKSFNFSCKDAIDRGALSSAFYNLIHSIELNHPLSRGEFERSLDAAAANVKGRGMNFHRKIIWNALNVYVNANYIQLMNDEKKSWLIYWRDMNCPKRRAEELLHIRLEQTIQQFKDLPKEKDCIRAIGLKLLNTVKQITEQKGSGKRLLLEVISRTSSLARNSSKESAKEYNKLADELKVNHPVLQNISGLMKILIGLILYIPSLGYSTKLITSGFAAVNKGFFAQNRTQLSQEMRMFLSDDALNTASMQAPLVFA